ncbi:MAG: hypothetical protein N2512_08885, partial [Armatimonadetes bacterium]|nr:hypothetical protein [Armatimonadota bacterium]
FHAEGGGVVVATPSWEEAARCQWVIILDRGRVLAAGEPSGLAQTAQGHVWELATQSLTEETLTSLPWVASARRRGSLVRIISDQRVDSQAVSMALSQVVRGSEARPVEPTLEDAMILLMYSTRARGTATGHGVAGI